MLTSDELIQENAALREENAALKEKLKQQAEDNAKLTALLLKLPEHPATKRLTGGDNQRRIKPSTQRLLSKVKRALRKTDSDTNLSTSDVELLRNSEWFDGKWYLQEYPDAALLDMHPAEHYYKFGAKLGRNPSVNFDTEFYLERYPDVAESGMNPLVHYILHGAREGRHCSENKLDVLEDKMWSGHAITACRVLTEILDNERALLRERYLAAWSLARYRSFSGEHQEALALSFKMAELLPEQRLNKTRVLLQANSQLKLEQPNEAAAILNEYLAEDPDDPDTRLMLANTFSDDEQRLACINEMYQRHGYLPVTRIDEHKPLGFDNLTSKHDVSDGAVEPDEQREKVSIIMPIFKAEERIEIAINSLLNQTWRNIEVIAVDDCSPDDTVAVLNAIAARDSRVKVIQQPHNQGAYPARNRGLEEATGDLITTHDADDWSHPQKLEQQIELLRAQPEAQGVILSWVRASDDLHFTINWRPSDSIIHYSHSSFMLTREAVNTIGNWDEVRISADTEYIWRAQHYFGKEAILHGVAEVPMAFALDDESSLTRTKATHVSTVYFGLRQVYREICRWYHKRGLDPTAKTSIPKAMLRKQGDYQVFDTVVVADFLSKQNSRDVLSNARKLAEQGEKIALLHWPSFNSKQNRFFDEYFELLHEGLAEPVVFGDKVNAARLIVSDVELLVYPVVATPEFYGIESALLYDRRAAPVTDPHSSVIQQAKEALADTFKMSSGHIDVKNISEE
ncbi:glycosyltransferase [Idiomarina sp. UBA3162]|uniref:glycosyltransferase n=1 Tax=Idiomarina sp. UBA3162 TaxID=1946641 RepID=UPI000C993A3B|nr:glycosyltransferase [Idiomarina sp. UBA3162]MAD52447.1 hypothetical protein [Idiomarinaceae bacterium]|tara:strand:+ start:2145 stop:4364 length:2220 start_codon:yes stop_codon:yes gene_type:complete